MCMPEGAPGVEGGSSPRAAARVRRWGTRRSRLTTNLAVRYDQLFVVRDAGHATVTARPVPLKSARVGRTGFAREPSLDGGLPRL